MVQYEHDIDNVIINSLYNRGKVRRLSFGELYSKIHEIFPNVTPKTLTTHLKKLELFRKIYKDRTKRKYNVIYYSLTEHSIQEIEYYGNVQYIRSKRENRRKTRVRLTDSDGDIEGMKETEQEEIQNIIYLNLLLQAADGSSRFVPTFTNVHSKKIDLVSFEREVGVTVQDIVEHKDVGNGGIFGHIKFTVPVVQKCIDVLENKYGIDIEKHIDRNLNIYNTLEEHITSAGSNFDDLIKRTKRNDKDNVNEIGIAINDDNLRCFIGMMACLIFMIMDRIRYTWLFKRKPRHNSWEFEWHTTFFGREKTLELIEKSEYILPSLKNKGNKKRLQDYFRKNIESYWSRLRREIEPALIERGIQDDFNITLHDKKRVDSLIRQTDRRITRLYHERIKCDRYEKIYCDNKHGQNDRCERCQKFHDKYEKYCKFVKDIFTNHNNKSNALIDPLIELVYPQKLRKLHENQEQKQRLESI
jgi:DNA-binding HxlR family transcriptional regulator